jgi:fucose 4-O-acetylase-like acetyltransferase
VLIFAIINSENAHGDDILITLREKWIDLSKGILIILVIVGHFYQESHWTFTHYVNYVYLFHMPAFFILSGYLYKPIEPLKQSIMKIAKRLIIPYASYLLIISLVRYLYLFNSNNLTINFVTKDIIRNLYGGQHLPFEGGILWFLSCLFFVEVFWTIINVATKSDKTKILIVLSLYLLAHVQVFLSQIIHIPLTLPFEIEVSFLCLSYYSFGFYAKDYIFNKKVFSFALLFSIAFLYLRLSNTIHYGLEIATHHYTNIILDFIVPIALSLVLFNICHYAKFLQTKVLLKLGTVTLPIMCLHILSNSLLQNFFHYGLIIFTLTGIVIPFAITILFLEKNKNLSKYFLGKAIPLPKN